MDERIIMIQMSVHIFRTAYLSSRMPDKKLSTAFFKFVESFDTSFAAPRTTSDEDPVSEAPF